ncbi:MAG: heavy-metal-associated domain-containing protein [Cyanobacteria bacterium REEB459]|nr:heavy-metal-associated domain-containing protein [Cyanobacteria bacterium REEB459]
MPTLRFVIPDMACGACAETITQALRSIDPIAAVSTDLQTKRIEIQTNLDQTLVIEGIQRAGYTVEQ